jgi:hypothetical protein
MEEQYDIKWISTAERLPPCGVLVFFQKTDASVQMGHRTGKTWIQNGTIREGEPSTRIPQKDIVAWAKEWETKRD